MTILLQKTKLFIPPARVRLVHRPRLMERLDQLRGEGSRAALISAPAGSGKTTLLAGFRWMRGTTYLRVFLRTLSPLRKRLCRGQGQAPYLCSNCRVWTQMKLSPC